MDKKTDIIAVELYTGQAWEAALVKILLKNKGINVLLRKDKSTAATGKLTYHAWDTVTVIVSDKDSEKARQVINEYERKAAEGYFQP